MNLIIFCNLECRDLEDGFILVQARLVVPCSYVSSRVPYKYVVWKEERKDSKEKERAKYLWEYLVGWGNHKNRCLQIPKDRCGPGGVLLFKSLSCVQKLCDESKIWSWCNHYNP